MGRWRFTVVPKIRQKRKLLFLGSTLYLLIVVEGNLTSPKSPASKSIRSSPKSNVLVEDLEVKRLDLFSFLAFVLSLRKKRKDLCDVC